MSLPGRVLVMDDDARWRDTLSSLLARQGIVVDTADTLAAALELVRNSLYHLLVLDIRMVDPDESNVEGMQLLDTLAGEGLLDALAVIMLSAYGKEEQMRKAFRQYKVTDFQSKRSFSGREFVKLVQKMFTEDLRVNLNLKINWSTTDKMQQIVGNLLLEEKRVKHDAALQDRVTLELDDLLCRLFHKADSILVHPMTPGRSGASVLKIQPFFASGPGAAVVVKFGDFRQIDQEYRNYLEYVQDYVGGGRHTAVAALRRTPLLGGIIYSVMGGPAGVSYTSLGDYYRNSTIDDIRKVLDHLFLETCENWYKNRTTLQPRNLTQEYESLLNCSVDKLQHALEERLDTGVSAEGLRFAGLPTASDFVNPIAVLADKQLVYPAVTAITHGDLNENNVLVDENKYVWLIDFMRTGYGHILRDLAELESVVRLHLLEAKAATLPERLAMERLLVQTDHFSHAERLAGELPTENEALAKAFHTCIHLRKIAHQVLRAGPYDTMDDYWVALLYFALNTIRFYSLSKLQREHALLSASILAQRLGLEVKHE